MTPALYRLAFLICCAVVPAVAAAQFVDPPERDHDHGHGHAAATRPLAGGPTPVVGGASATRPAPDHDHQHENEGGKHDHGQPEQGHDHKRDEGHADEVKLSRDAITRNGIRVEKVARQRLSDVLVVAARVDFDRDQMAHVGATVQGRAVEVKATVGDAVKKGDELLVVESPQLGEAQSEFLVKRTAVDIARSAVDPLRLSFERAKSLHEKSEGIALAEVQRREADYRAAVGAVETARVSAEAAENRLHVLGMDQDAVVALVKSREVRPRYAVRAPLGGLVIEREVTLGEVVSPDRDALMILANTTRLWVLADVPEAKLGQLAPGAKARVTVAALPGEQLAGEVSHVSPVVDPATRTARVRIVVDNPGGRLRPGMFAKAEIDVRGAGGGEAVLAVPDAAVQTVEGKPAVFVPVEGEPNTFARREVRLGDRVGRMVPVLSGLAEGEPYVAAGTFILKAELGKGSAHHEH